MNDEFSTVMMYPLLRIEDVKLRYQGKGKKTFQLQKSEPDVVQVTFIGLRWWKYGENMVKMSS